MGRIVAWFGSRLKPKSNCYCGKPAKERFCSDACEEDQIWQSAW